MCMLCRGCRTRWTDSFEEDGYWKMIGREEDFCCVRYGVVDWFRGVWPVVSMMQQMAWSIHGHDADRGSISLGLKAVTFFGSTELCEAECPASDSLIFVVPVESIFTGCSGLIESSDLFRPANQFTFQCAVKSVVCC